MTAADRRLLARAVEIARRGWGRVHPNPMAGAVVTRDGRVVGEGWHEEFGGPHAEAVALARAGDARGTTLYASLEPCAHQGKTPPCAEAVRDAGVARVVYWAADPGRRSGGGGAWLRRRGVQVDGPFGDPGEWAAENPAFFHAASSDRPYVAIKLAASLDGRIAPPAGRRVWLTAEEARREVHRLRAGFGAVMVGTRTWKADDPRLTARGPVASRIPPLRVLLDRRGELPNDARALDARLGRPPLVVAAPDAAARLRKRLGDRAEVVEAPLAASDDPLHRSGQPAPVALPAPEGRPPPGRPALDGRPPPVARPAPTGRPPPRPRLELAAVLQLLAARGVDSILCEGGGRLAASLLSAGLADRLYYFVAPVLLGPDAVPAFPLNGSGGGAVPEPAGVLQGWTARLAPVRYGADTLVVLDRER